MFKYIKELVDLMEYINENDGLLKLDLKFMNNQLCFILNDGIEMNSRALESEEDIKDIISTLDFRKAVISPIVDEFESIEDREWLGVM